MTAPLLTSWVTKALVDRGGSLVLVGAEKRKKEGGSRYVTLPWTAPFAELSEALQAGADGDADRKEVYLCDPNLTNITSLAEDNITRFALNGCPRLYWVDETVESARLALLGHVDSIRSTHSGQVVSHRDYTELYERIRKVVMAQSTPVAGPYAQTKWSGARVAKQLLER